MTEEELSRQYYESQVKWIDYHSYYPPSIKIRGEKTDTKWMNLNPISAEIIVKKLIEEFKLEIK